MFSFNDINAKRVRLSAYEDKVTLIVKTENQFGYTMQYAELELLYNTYNSRGFEVIAVPSPYFDNQEYEQSD